MTLRYDHPPRAAYVHVPFCRHRCGYCNFTLVAGRDDLVEPYLDAIERELAAIEATEVDTLYFGGGTPTHLDAAALERLLRLVAATFPLANGGELSVEANPADLDSSRVDVLGRSGTTRVSLGGQSFAADKLTLLERDHVADDIAAAVELVCAAGCQVALDLIFAAPGESLGDWQRELQAALELAPEHVSTYGLTFEEGTTFWSRRARGELTEVDEETQRAMYLEAIDRLTDAGYEHYEVSNFARRGCRSRHNEVYWTGRSYHAVGPGAARFVAGRRETNHRSTTTYIKRMLAGASPVAESEQLSGADAARERLVFALRRLEGIDLKRFAAETGCEVAELVGRHLDEHLAAGRLIRERDTLRLSREGLLVSDAIWSDFLSC
ncbi:MAG: coproporphyrinogen III oxidase family protein [Planctomycetota bacterium]|nr:MAG: coproporphyrinogen III oxidase family protein [Planctomycetota bacterium]REJ86692.1 MAG: coproporphyrinogen III oxidase family protein [Planctomycetota bacterium]